MRHSLISHLEKREGKLLQEMDGKNEDLLDRRGTKTPDSSLWLSSQGCLEKWETWSGVVTQDQEETEV